MKTSSPFVLAATLALAASTSFAAPVQRLSARNLVSITATPGTASELRADVDGTLQTQRRCLRRRDAEKPARRGNSITVGWTHSSGPGHVAPSKRDLVPALSSMSVNDLQQLQQLATDAEADRLQQGASVANSSTNKALDLGGALGPLLGSVTSTVAPVTSGVLGAIPGASGVASTVAGLAQQINSILLPLVTGILTSAIQTASGLPILGSTVSNVASTLDLSGTINQIGQIEGSLISGLLTPPSSARGAAPKAATNAAISQPRINLSLPVAPSDSKKQTDDVDDATF